MSLGDNAAVMPEHSNPVLSDEQLTAFELEARRLLREHRVPGVSVALVTPQGEHFVNLGVTSLTNPLPITSDTLFQIGSITKTMTALALALLEQEEHLQLTDRVQKYLPELNLKDEQVTRNVTVQDLLTHMGGWWGDYFHDTGNGDDAVQKVVETLANIDQTVPLGRVWGYNNAGFYIAGRIMEVITGKTFEAALTELVLEPLGMTETLFFANQIMTRRFAAGHNEKDGEVSVVPDWQLMRSSAPAGGTLSSSVRDMGHYARYLMTGEGVKPGTPLARFNRSQLWQPLCHVGFRPGMIPADMGLAWFIVQDGHQHQISHDGGTDGHNSSFTCLLSHNVTLISLTNGMSGGAFNGALTRYLKHELLGMPRPVQPPALNLTPAELQAFVGEYRLTSSFPDEDRTMIVFLQGDQPMLRYGPNETAEPVPLRFFTPTAAQLVGGPFENLIVQFFAEEQTPAFVARAGTRLFPRVPE